MQYLKLGLANAVKREKTSFFDIQAKAQQDHGRYKQNNKYQTRSLKQILKQGLIPESLSSKLDLDRINEEREDFLHVDKTKRLRMSKIYMKP